MRSIVTLQATTKFKSFSAERTVVLAAAPGRVHAGAGILASLRVSITRCHDLAGTGRRDVGRDPEVPQFD
jgi:hypothetical protein